MSEEVPSPDQLAYGTDRVHLMSDTGMDEIMIAETLILSNSFEIATAKPGEIAPEQTTTAFILTMKGADSLTKAPRAVTLVFDPTMANALFKSLRMKFVEIPIQHR